jgi:HEAT repeat protein
MPWISFSSAGLSEHLIASYGRASPEVRGMLVEYLSHVGAGPSLDRLGEWYFQETDAALRRRLASALILADSSRAPGVFHALWAVESDEDVRDGMIGALAEAKSTDALQILSTWAREGQPRQRATVLRSLARYRGFETQFKERVLTDGLADTCEDVRIAAIETLARVDAKKHLDLIRSIAQRDPSPRVRNTAQAIVSRWE